MAILFKSDEIIQIITSIHNYFLLIIWCLFTIKLFIQSIQQICTYAQIHIFIYPDNIKKSIIKLKQINEKNRYHC